MGAKNNRQFGGEKEYEIDLLGLARYLFSKILWIIAAGILCAVIVFGVEKFFIQPEYESYVTMYVYNNPEIERSSGAISGSDIQASESLAETYKVILQSNIVLDAVRNRVSEATDAKYSRSQLRDMMDVTTENNTQILKISIRSPYPGMAKAVAKTFAAVAPSQITRVTKAGGVEVIDNAEYPNRPVLPRVERDSALGFIGGAVVAIICFAIKLLSDNTIYVSEDIEKIEGLTVLGQIPNIKGMKTENGWKAVPGRTLHSGGQKL